MLRIRKAAKRGSSQVNHILKKIPKITDDGAAVEQVRLAQTKDVPRMGQEVSLCTVNNDTEYQWEWGSGEGLESDCLISRAFSVKRLKLARHR